MSTRYSRDQVVRGVAGYGVFRLAEDAPPGGPDRWYVVRFRGLSLFGFVNNLSDELLGAVNFGDGPDMTFERVPGAGFEATFNERNYGPVFLRNLPPEPPPGLSVEEAAKRPGLYEAGSSLYLSNGVEVFTLTPALCVKPTCPTQTAYLLKKFPVCPGERFEPSPRYCVVPARAPGVSAARVDDYVLVSH